MIFKQLDIHGNLFVLDSCIFAFDTFLLQIIKKVPQLGGAVCSGIEFYLEHPSAPSLLSSIMIAKMRSKVKRKTYIEELGKDSEVNETIPLYNG